MPSIIRTSLTVDHVGRNSNNCLARFSQQLYVHARDITKIYTCKKRKYLSATPLWCGYVKKGARKYYPASTWKRGPNAFSMLKQHQSGECPWFLAAFSYKLRYIVVIQMAISTNLMAMTYRNVWDMCMRSIYIKHKKNSEKSAKSGITKNGIMIIFSMNKTMDRQQVVH